MISSILTASYLWKDTWKRWLEQPGSILARSVVTIIMVSLSVLLLVGFRMQIEKLRSQVEAFGLNNLLVIETITPQDLDAGEPEGRFRSLKRWGALFTAQRMLASARGSNGKNAVVVGYSDDDMPGLVPYLRYGHEVFVLSRDMPQGIVVDYDLGEESCRAVALKPKENVSQLLQGDTLFMPIRRLGDIPQRGYSIIYYLERDESAPPIASLSEAVRRLVRVDGEGKVDVQSAEMLRKKVEELERKQESMRWWLAGLMGGALALIYGVLSVLEFRQSEYVTALLKSFGVSEFLLGLRTVVENAIIVNVMTLVVIFVLSRFHDKIFGALKVKAIDDVNLLYWGQETLWIFGAANIGIVLSCLPVFWALRKPVGKVLD